MPPKPTAKQQPAKVLPKAPPAAAKPAGNGPAKAPAAASSQKVPAKPQGKAAPAPNGQHVEVPLKVNGVEVPMGKLKITATLARKILGWETETEYTIRKTAADPQVKPEAAVFGEEFLLTDENGDKVKCWCNGKNRPFNETWSRTLAQSVLNRQYLFNRETIIIDGDLGTGDVDSGQHRLVGLVLADQIRKKKPQVWVKHWRENEECFIESLVVSGGPPMDHKVRSTLDQVRPRNLSDVLYTSDIFSKLSLAEKKECSRMLSKAIDFLWERTRAGDGENNPYMKYQSNQASLDFLERHPRLVECVNHLFEENKSRGISKLDSLSPGECAAMMYLAGSCKTNGDDYRNLETPQEGKPGAKGALDWSMWDVAQEFFVLLAGCSNNESSPFLDVKMALIGLKGVDMMRRGSSNEKAVVLAKAWQAFKQDKSAPTPEDLSMENSYAEEYADDGSLIKKELADPADFGGIDLGPKLKKLEAGDESVPTEEEIEAEKQRLREEHLAQDRERVEQYKAKAKGK